MRAFELCAPGAQLTHLHVVPELWRGMMGDDWLNNAATRERYGQHIESELQREIESLRTRLAAEANPRQIQYAHRSVIGDPAGCLITLANEIEPEMVVIGAQRRRGQPGLRSRMDLDALSKALRAPLLIVPLAAQ